MVSGRNELRKAQTRSTIVRAAHELFVDRGYAETSMEDISHAADVAIRTIYLHFESKAAVLLAYHDIWLDAFVRLLGERRPGEALDAVLARSLDALDAEGLGNDRRIEEVAVLPPFLEFIGSGSPEIAGHLLHRWVAAQDALTVRFREISGATPESPLPRQEASAVFAVWMTSILDFRERWTAGIPGSSSNDVAVETMRAFVGGLATPD